MQIVFEQKTSKLFIYLWVSVKNLTVFIKWCILSLAANCFVLKHFRGNKITCLKFFSVQQKSRKNSILCWTRLCYSEASKFPRHFQECRRQNMLLVVSQFVLLSVCQNASLARLLFALSEWASRSKTTSSAPCLRECAVTNPCGPRDLALINMRRARRFAASVLTPHRVCF